MVHPSLAVSALLFAATDAARIHSNKHIDAAADAVIDAHVWIQQGDEYTMCKNGWDKKVPSEDECKAKAVKAGSTFYSFTSEKGGRCKHGKKCKLHSGTKQNWRTYKLEKASAPEQKTEPKLVAATSSKGHSPVNLKPVVAATQPGAEANDAQGATWSKEEDGSSTDRKVEMTKIGAGFCPEGYVGGWDGLYLLEEECIQYCLKSPKCHAVSYCPQGEEACLWGGSCSRYEKPCPVESLNTTGEVGIVSKTFSKAAYTTVTFDDHYDVAAESKKSGERLVEFVRAQVAARQGSGNLKVALVSMLGSYAPLTKGHLNAFIITRKELLNRGFDLVLGVMSMNPEGHVKAKLAAKGQTNVDFATRHALANCAFKDAGAQDWMFTESGQTQHFWKLKNALKQSGDPVDLQLFFMNGADDVFAGRKYNECGKTFSDGRKFVMVGRPGETDKVQEQLKKLGISGDDLDCLWVDNANGYSSSMLRGSAQEGDWDTVWEISDRCVAAFMNGPWLERYREEQGIEDPEEDDQASFMETDPRAWSE